MANDCIPLYEPGARISAKATAAVIGKRCVAISGNRTSGPGLSATSEGGNYQVAPATAGGRIFGVAVWDAPTGALVPVICTPGIVVPIKAEAAIVAGAQVQVGVAGQVITFTTGVAIGTCLSAAAIGADAEIKLN